MWETVGRVGREVAERGERARIAVALVGREAPDDENLALRYLASALSSAAHRPEVVPLCGPHDVAGATERVLQLNAELVGISISDADIGVDAFAFVRHLREHGYRGHITCGGPLATLVRQELLDKHPAFDSVIRHDGEVPLVELADRIAARRAWDDVPGISTRRGDGPPAPVDDPTPIRIRPLRRDALPTLLGVPTARISCSRGCPGRCTYCGPAALQREVVQEGLNRGLLRRELRLAGIGRTRHRASIPVAEEVADLYHEHGARFFQLVDENLLSGDADVVATWLRELIRELSLRRVGKTAWCLQADPATLTPEVVDLLEELGVIRLSVGIEGLTKTRTHDLGRRGDPAPNRALLEQLRDRGFVPRRDRARVR